MVCQPSRRDKGRQPRVLTLGRVVMMRKEALKVVIRP
jgi:hypothetical protein